MKSITIKKVYLLVKLLLFLILFGSTYVVKANDFIVTDYKQFKGKVFNVDTKKTLESVHLFIEDLNINTVTNKDGEFLLKVPIAFLNKNIVISYLGYDKKIIKIADLKTEKNKIYLKPSSIQLAAININTLSNPKALVKEVYKKRGDNYLDHHSVMTAFYRETIKKKHKNLSLTEAIVTIYKTPYESEKRDVLEFYKTRKKTNYTKLDTLAFKLRGGPFNTLFLDVVKYPKYVFAEKSFDEYDFSFKESTMIDGTLIYVIHFKAKKEYSSILYQGDLFIDYQNKTLTSATYELNLTNKKNARDWFSIKKPFKSEVTPTYAKYDLKYFEKDNKWYHGYSKMALGFKVNWDKKLFNSNYNMISEMAITDWKENKALDVPTFKDRVKSSVVMADYPVGFSDDNFWGAHNIIEPDKSIERAIKKIKKNIE